MITSESTAQSATIASDLESTTGRLPMSMLMGKFLTIIEFLKGSSWLLIPYPSIYRQDMSPAEPMNKIYLYEW